MVKKTDHWRTPEKIYKILNDEFNFDFDPCPFMGHNEFNGLEISWGYCNFVNPPYSETEKWVLKSLEEFKEGKKIVLLLRLDASTKWFRDLILPNAEVRLFEDRLRFKDLEGVERRSDHASILCILNASKKRLNMPVIYWRK